MSELLHEYAQLWREAFSESDWRDRLFARLTIIVMHTAFIVAAILLVTALRV